ncbi:PQ-loop domain-containing transporter [Metamycoplasma auris]|uniref:PQ loop repeat protein n=1 Tax=Metamycoplasma auris TaxID=51363 RepID=A0A2W7G6L5_9BACT|nr:PQ-loop domain-containing transporter [Metamycoplasma auris]PZW01574.1 PQ loop repeat protein [Metamycoplasma auris]
MILDIFIQIFGAAGAIFTISLGIPQLIRLLKNKKAENINYYSFWIFFVGIVIWIIYGVFTPNEDGWYVFLANLICGIIFSFTIYYTYAYNKEITKKQLKIATLFIVLIDLLIAAFFAVFVVLVIQKIQTKMFYPKENNKIATFSKNASIIIGLITPSLTALAFLPQLVKGFMTKNFHGLSPWMPFLFILNCLSWMLFFTLVVIKAKKPGTDIEESKSIINAAIGALIWQSLAVILYTVQFAFIIVHEQKIKKAQFIVKEA